MPRDDKAFSRTLVVSVLVLLAIVALRGYLPGAQPSPEPAESPHGGVGSLVAIVAMLGVSIAVIAISIATQARRRVGAPASNAPPRDIGGERSRLTWRMLVVAALILVVWSVVVILLMRWGHRFTLGDVPATDGQNADAPAPGGDRRPPESPPEPPQGQGPSAFGYLAATTIVLFVLSMIATVMGRRRGGATSAVPVETASPTTAPRVGPDLARAAEVGLAEIGDHSRDPREAIIACYVAMERELEKSPGTIPRDSDTPTEVLERAVERHALGADSATQLVDLFEEARFSPHVMNEGHRDDAVQALRRVQSELQGAT